MRTGVYVENLTEECVSTMKDVTKLLMKVQTATFSYNIVLDRRILLGSSAPPLKVETNLSLP